MACVVIASAHYSKTEVTIVSKELRQILERASTEVDYSKPVFQRQIAEIDREQLRADLERLATRTLVLTHAYDVMESGTHPHPMQAFVHATQCEGPISDSEFFALLASWARMCGSPQPVVVGGLSSQDFSSILRTFDGKDR